MKKVTVRKGAGKAHRALKHDDGHLVIICGCPGTANGSLANRAAVIAEGWDKANCRNKRHP